ncbi:MAG: hypothetical protein ACRECO_04525 [Xanthobacteraceae bacterium]
MIRAAVTLAIALVSAVAIASSAGAQTSLPTGKGLPVQVKVGVAFVDIVSFKESTGIFNGTVDVRLRWQDLRLRRPAGEANDPPRVYRGAAATAQASKIWVPAAELANQRGKVAYTTTGLRIYPDGTIELIKRTAGDFATNFNVERFPFDRQKLRIDVAVRDQDTDAIALVFEQSDLDFSRAAAKASLDGWDLGFVALRSEPLAGWHGASHPRVVASLEIIRQPGTIIAAVFIPLFASLLIPLLAIWLNRVDDGIFQIETFELVNIIIGGLFAVIALNFTVNSVHEVLGSGDNPVNRLFALNYVTLGLSLLVNVLLFRYGVVERMFGRYVQEQLYIYLTWAIPTLALTMAAAVVLVAVA